MWGTKDANSPVPGDVVEVSGESFPGAYAPTIKNARWKKLGTAPLPEAKPVSIERLMSGTEDSQRVEISGIVRTAQAGRNRIQDILKEKEALEKVFVKLEDRSVNETNYIAKCLPEFVTIAKTPKTLVAVSDDVKITRILESSSLANPGFCMRIQGLSASVT